MTDELILIVEDNAQNRKLVRDLLKSQGYRTVDVTTAEEGLEIARVRQPSLILMDIHLPKMDGLTAFKLLRGDPLTQRIPIIAVTASAMPDDVKEIIEIGFDGYQTKPIHVKEFVALVRGMLDDRDSNRGQ